MQKTSISADFRLIATTDLHLALRPYDYISDTQSPGQGLSGIAAAVHAMKQDGVPTLFVDNGDFLQGTPMSEVWDPRDGTIHPMIKAMNLAGVQAGCIGNHEFNFGLDYLNAALKGAEFPCLLANIVRRRGVTADQDERLFTPTTVVNLRLTSDHIVRIGLIGLAPPQIMHWDKCLLTGKLEARDMLETAHALVPALRAQCDLVFGLCHTGFGDPDPKPYQENAALPLAASGLFDAIIAGHTHLTCAMAHDTTGTPIVQPGGHGSHIGIIDFSIRDGCIQGHPRLTEMHARSEPPCPAILSETQSFHDKTLAHIRTRIGTNAEWMHSYFSMITPGPCVKVIAEAQYHALAQRLAHENPVTGDVPVLSAASAFRCGGRGGAGNFVDIPPGDLYFRHAFDLYPFPNSPVALEVSGAVIREWLEKSASVFRHIPSGKHSESLIDDGFAPYDFDTIYGLDYTINPGHPPKYHQDGTILHPLARRISELRHQGRIVQDDDRFIMITNSYRADGGGNFPILTDAKVLIRPSVLIRDAIARYLKHGVTRPRFAPQPWRFASLPDTSAAFLSAPQGRDVIPDNVTHEGRDANGFDRYRLHFG